MKKKLALILALAMLMALFSGVAAGAADETAGEPLSELAEETADEESLPKDAVTEEPESADEPEKALSAPVLDGASSKSGYNPSSTYLAFASDRHTVTTAISTAMSGMPDAVSYVCMMGDMVNGKGSKAAAYNSSTILAEAQEMFGKSVSVDITYGDHDINCHDDAGIFHRNTELIETGCRDGTVQYYVYGVSMDDMTSASAAKTEAERFMRWVDENCRDTRIPIIVVCHVPMHYAREDNPGGEYWSLALNYAATGYASMDSGKKIIRNVIFFHGHNHTTPSESRNYHNDKPGTSGFVVQGESGSVSGTIYYSYLTAGYTGLESEGGGAGIKSVHSTLLEITDTQLILTQYPAGSVSAAAKLQSIDRVPASEVPEVPRPTDGPGEPAAIPGDANADGALDGFDAALILRYAVGLPVDPESFHEDAADHNGDSKANEQDAALILAALQ